MARKIVKNKKNEFVWVITTFTYRANVDWIYIEEYRQPNGSTEVDHQCTILDRIEYTALYDFIGNFCPFWDDPVEEDQYGDVEAI